MSDQPGPYAQAALFYLQQGWAPIPLPYQKKKPPPENWTGYLAPYPSAADVHEWAMNGKGSGNIGLRMREDVIGVDVDAYGAKQGASSLAALEARLGPLPPTYSSSARVDDPTSRIRFYRVRRTGRLWADTAGPDIEIIHYGHRYAVAAPSIHPLLGTEYHWWDLDGNICPIPHVSQLTLLPQAHEDEYDCGDVSERATKAELGTADALESLRLYPQGDMCKVMTELVSRSASLASSGSRHDNVRSLVAAVVRAGERGHNGSMEALGLIHETWLRALQFGERRTPDAGEFERLVTGAVAIVTDDPTAPADIGCCGSTVLSPALSFDPTGEDAFWSARPEFEVIRQYAHARIVSPWAVLGCVLTRCLVSIEPHNVLPPIVGAEGSLNFFCALVGPTGSGKGVAADVAAEAVRLPEIHHANVGSGEGIAHQYKRREKGQIVTVRTSVLFTIGEVDTMTALSSRQGSTLLSELRKAWSGSRLGFSNADQTRTIPLEKGSYRLGLVMEMQPGRAGQLFSEAEVAGGTPGRFLFMPSVDPHMPPFPPVEPAAVDWSRPERLFPSSMGNNRVRVCQSAVETIRGNMSAVHRDGVAPLDGHALQTRLKVAVALAVLAGRIDVEEDDWALSAVVMRVSDQTRAAITSHLASRSHEANMARGRADAQRQLVTAEVLDEAKVARVSRAVVRGLAKATELLTLRDVKHLVNNRDRDVVPEALAALVASGQIREVKREESVHYEAVAETDK